MPNNSDTSTTLTGMIGKPIRHLHHNGEWFDYATEPIENRIAHIRARKADHEVETRLRLLKPVAGKLPEAVAGANAAKAAAGEKDDAARAAAWEKYDAARMAAREKYGAARMAAGETYRAATVAAQKTYCAAEDRYAAALSAHRTELDALHWEECGQYGCPWTPENRTIFPEDSNGK